MKKYNYTCFGCVSECTLSCCEEQSQCSLPTHCPWEAERPENAEIKWELIAPPNLTSELADGPAPVRSADILNGICRRCCGSKRIYTTTLNSAASVICPECHGTGQQS